VPGFDRSFSNGRYAFVVLVPALGWLAASLFEAFPRRARLLVAVAVGGYFVGHGFPWFVARATSQWFAGGG
jgi:hypothetical protein